MFKYNEIRTKMTLEEEEGETCRFRDHRANKKNTYIPSICDLIFLLIENMTIIFFSSILFIRLTVKHKPSNLCILLTFVGSYYEEMVVGRVYMHQLIILIYFCISKVFLK
jgi:hypothetical protein